MATAPESPEALEASNSAAHQAFGAAQKFLMNLSMLAAWARAFDPNAPLYPPGTHGHAMGLDKSEHLDVWPRVPLDWDAKAIIFAETFITWYDLTHFLTPSVCIQARRVYPPGWASIKLSGGGLAPPIGTAPANVRTRAASARKSIAETPYPTVIEAVNDGLGVFFRNAIYQDRRHPLDPDLERVTNEAKSRATARQVAKGMAPEPMGWGADCAELLKQETRAAVRARLGLKTRYDVQALMMQEWRSQDSATRESVPYLFRFDSIDFDDLEVQLGREAEAVLAAESKPIPTPMAGDPGAMERAVELAAARLAAEMKARDSHESPKAKLPPLKPWAWEAWKAKQVGMTVTAIAKELARKYHDPKITQPRVTEQIKCARLHAEASGLAGDAARALPQVGSKAPARTVDPTAAEQGERTDGRSHHIRERARQKAKDGEDDEK